MKRLIINADDFGLAPGVNRAIVELQQAGALSSTTLMATGPYFSPAVYLAFAQPALAVGCHVVLVDGSPSAPGRGAFAARSPESVGVPLRPRWEVFFVTCYAAAFASRKLRPRPSPRYDVFNRAVSPSATSTRTNISTRFPVRWLPCSVRRGSAGWTACAIHSSHGGACAPPGSPARGAGRKCTPCEPSGKAFTRLTKEHGMWTADGSIGVLATGSLDDSVLRSLLQAMPGGHMGAGLPSGV